MHLDDGTVLGFQFEYEDTIEKTSFKQLRHSEKYNAQSDNEINNIIKKRMAWKGETFS